MKRVLNCIVCGGSRCMEFEDKYYCFRFGITRKKGSGTGQCRRIKEKSTGSFEGGEGGTFSKVPPSKSNEKQRTFDFGDSIHLDAISL